jgi:hypothetical protein
MAGQSGRTRYQIPGLFTLVVAHKWIVKNFEGRLRSFSAEGGLRPGILCRVGKDLKNICNLGPFTSLLGVRGFSLYIPDRSPVNGTDQK